MARLIHSRLKIKGDLVAQTPLHVGGYGESFETDMALSRNGKDEFYIPGTSLAGSLRSWFRNAFGKDEMEKLFGKEEAEFASFVFIEDMTLDEQVQSELRDGVGIDRYYGTAAEGIKFDRAILPKGTKLKFEMTVEIQTEAQAKKTKAMFGHLLDALTKGNVRLGASKTRGLGKVKLELQSIEEYPLNGFDAVLSLIEGKPADTYTVEKLKNEDANARPTCSQLLTITIRWQPKSPLMVKAGYEGIGVDMLPLTSGNGEGKVSLCLPGSSIKGAFRAQAERILRTLFDIEAPRNESDNQNFSKQLQVFDKNGKSTKATELIGILFGAKKEPGKSDKLGLGALSIDDCYARLQIDSDLWSSVETGEVEKEKSYYTQSLWQAMRAIDLNKKVSGLTDDEKKTDTTAFKISHHVAIDRWTGGASDGALYGVLQPSPSIGWEDITMTLDFSRLPDEATKKRCLMLLLVVLRDFAENRVPLGFATNRGMGEVEVLDIKLQGSGFTGDLTCLNKAGNDWLVLSKSNVSSLDDGLKKVLQEEWDKWLKNN